MFSCADDASAAVLFAVSPEAAPESNAVELFVSNAALSATPPPVSVCE